MPERTGGYYIRSPDGKLELRLYLGDVGTERNCLLYNLTICDSPVITGSRLGLLFGNGVSPFGSSLTVTKMTKSSLNSTYTIAFGERDRYPDRYSSMTLVVNDPPSSGRSMSLEARAYDEGVAFRYVSGSAGWPASVLITGELTGFNFKSDHDCYTEYGTEGSYTCESLRQVSSKCESPLTVELNDGKYVSITEANTTDHSRMYLNRDTATTNGLRAQLDSSVSRNVPFQTPWRVIVYGSSPGQLVANGHILNSLCPPSIIKNTSWIMPGKAFRDCSLTTTGSKEVIDFCAKNGLQYVHLDAGWYGSEWSSTDATKVAAPNLNLTEVIRYGNTKGIGVILYVNERALNGKIGTLFPLYENWGIKGVKFGFVDGRTQSGINFLHSAIKKAGEHHLIVNIHDNYRPTGLSRTYPNLLTVEGVRGNEHFPLPKHNTILPYTRMVCGLVDYTPRYQPSDGKTTYSHQLSLPIMYFSPLTYLYWYHKPSQVVGKNGTGLWATMPTVWDETRYLEGDPGSYSTVARRTGEDWYWCCVNGPSANSITADLDFLKKSTIYNATFYRDGQDGSVQIESYLVDRSISLNEKVEATGGISARLKPATAKDLKDLNSYMPGYTIFKDQVFPEDEPIKIKFLNLNGWEAPSMDLLTDAAFLVLDAENGTISGKAGNDDVGQYGVSVKLKEEFFGLGDLSFGLSIENTNDDPRIITDPVRKVRWNTDYVMTFHAVDIDPTNDILTWSLSTDASFLKMDPFNGTLYGRPVKDRMSSYWVNVSVHDGNGGSDHINYSLKVEGFADGSPFITTENLLAAREDELYINDYDCQADPVNLSVHWSMVSGPDFLQMDPLTGNLTGMPSDNDVGSWNVKISVVDEYGRSDSTSFVLDVYNVNDKPLIVGTPPRIWIAGQDHSYAFSLVDDDPASAGDVHTWTLLSPDFLSIGRSSGILSGTPSLEDIGHCVLEVHLSDGKGGKAQYSSVMEIRSPTGGPIIVSYPDPPMIISEDVEFNFQLEARSPDAPLIWKLLASPSFLSVDVSSGILSGTPGNDDVGVHSVRVQVSDPDGQVDEVSFEIEVRNVNDPPYITTSGLEDAVEGMEYHFEMSYIDIDPAGKDPFWSIQKGPSFLRIDNITGVLSGIPADPDTGVHIVLIRVDDGDGGMDIKLLRLEVIDVNSLPVVLDNEPVATLYEDSSAEIDLASIFMDPDGPSLFYSLSSSLYVECVLIGGHLALTPVLDWSGEELITIEVSDGEFLIQTNLMVKVLPVNDAPCDVEMILPSDLKEGSEHIFRGSATDVDIPFGDGLIFMWFVDGELLKVGDKAEFSLDAGNHEITLAVRDREGASNMTSKMVFVQKVDTDERGIDRDLWQLLMMSTVLISAIFAMIVILAIYRRRGKI